MNHIILPLPPSLNHAYITTKSGKRIMTNECRQYKEIAFWKVKSLVKKPLQKISKISFVFYWKDNRRKDYDNAVKITQDALKGSLIVDDCWQCVREINIKTGGIDRVNPRVEVSWEV